ncbi:TonB-dependent receptor [Terriglobus saanensis]|nr:carboxypeptidase-like regulatory domain-containing protein [Terriglobus saanensis]
MKNAKQRAGKTLVSIVLTMFFPFLAGVCWSQTTQQFTGHVVDPSGAVIPAAQVTIHNQATGVDVTTTTTSTGLYSAPYLTPGAYDITVTKDGFSTQQKTSIQLTVDQTSTIDFSMAVGAASEVVTVNASGAQVELSKADRGELIEGERVTQMPLDGRNPFNLVGLSPGVRDTSSSQYPRPFDNVTGNQYANGSPQVSQTNVDGVGNDASDLGRTAFTPSVDVVQAFKIVLNAYDASYGHSGGSSIDVSLKSGGNQIHGSVYEYMRRSWLDTNAWQSNYNNPANPSKAPHKRDQYGFELDGPIIIPHVFDGRNKLFFLASYEQMNDILPNPSYNVYSLPNPAWLTGDFSTATYWNSTTNSLQPLTIYDPLTPLHTVVDPIDGKTKLAHDPFPGNKVPSNRIDPVAANILSYYSYLNPNVNPGAGFAPWTNNYENLQVEHDLWRNAVFKVDYNLSDKDKFSFRWAGQGRWIAANWNTGAPADDPANSNGHGVAPLSETGQVQWTHIFSPTLLLNVGGSLLTYNNKQLEGTTFSDNIVAKLGFAAGYYNQLQNIHTFPYIQPTGLPNSANFADFGPNWLGYSGLRHTISLLPTVTYIHGAHSIRTGINMNFYQYVNPVGGNADTFQFTSNFSNHYYNSPDAPGYSSGASIASLLLGYPNSGTLNANIHQFWSQHYFAPWIQDDWKLTKKLTLNLGMRWDFLTPQVERHNKANGAFDPTVLNPVSSLIPGGTVALGTSTNLQGGLTFAGVNGVQRGAYAMNMLNVQPRIGFAYAISARMSIRGGIGENYLADTSANNADGFSSSTSYTNSLDNGITPYTATTGQGLSNPIASVQQPAGASRGYTQDLGQNFTFVNPHYKIPAVWSYSMTYEVALSKHDVVNVSYVGNRVSNLAVSDNINHISAQWNAQCDVERGGNRHICDDTATGQIANPFVGIAGFQGSSYYSSSIISKSAFTRSFPQFGDITENGSTSDGKSWYNSFQAVASHQVSSSLTLHATYTHAKAETSSGWVDTVNRVFARQVSTSSDVNHSITFSGVGYLPFGRGQLFASNANRFVDTLINGWQISPLFTYYSGLAWRPTDSGGSGGPYDYAGNWEMASTGAPIDKPMGVEHTVLPRDGTHGYTRLRGVTPCVGYKDTDTGQIIPSPAATAAGCTNIEFVRAPNAYAIGRANIDFGVRQPGAYKLDIAASKNFRIPEASKIFLGEAANLQLRADLLNAFNHANWDESYNNDPTSIDFGTISQGPSGPTNNPRYVQLSARLSW